MMKGKKVIDMTNWKLIKKVVKEVSDYYEAEHIMVSNKVIEKRVLDWYNHTDFAEVSLLAAAAILGDYDEDITYFEIMKMKDMLYFDIEGLGSVNCFDLSVDEIELALRDMEWM